MMMMMMMIMMLMMMMMLMTDNYDGVMTLENDKSMYTYHKNKYIVLKAKFQISNPKCVPKYDTGNIWNIVVLSVTFLCQTFLMLSLTMTVS